MWQGYFKSWYVTDEAYLYTLINYIEHNPVKTKIVKKLGEYLYSSYSSFIGIVEPIACLQNSFVFTDFKDNNERKSFLQGTADENILKEIKKASNLLVTSIKEKILDIQKLER